MLRRLSLLVVSLSLFAVAAPAQEPVAHARDRAAADEPASADTALKVVTLKITGDGSEDPRQENPLGPSKRNFRMKLEQIRAIAADPTVRAVRLKIEGNPGLAKSVDLLEELRAVKAAGKPIVCYSEMLTRNDLIFASIADHLCVPPSGLIALEGLLAESMYFKDLLARFDAKVEVLHIGDFKSAYEEFALDRMSAGQRTTLQVLLDEFWGQIIGTVADQRGMDRQVLEQLFADVFVVPEKAQRAGLVDQVAYEDGFDLAVEQLLGGKTTEVKDYGDRTKEDIEKMLESPFALFALLPALLDPPEPKAPTTPYVAIVYATGAINSGKSAADWQGNVSSMGSETIVAALDKAREDDNCKAVVLRVNSPGGSALASDMIWRAVERTKALKPVVSSMGSVAASGGYWISMGCSAIVAQSSTLTGSIGVVSMVPDLSATLAANGIRVETVSAGPAGDALALLAHPPSDLLKRALTQMMEETYDDFIEKVASGRRMEPARVLELAGGRVWTGRQAEENGLVDEIGGLTDSIHLAQALAGLSSDTPLFELPEPANPLEALEDVFQAKISVTSPVEDLLEAAGFGDTLAVVRTWLSQPQAVHPDRIQAVMPFGFVIR